MVSIIIPSYNNLELLKKCVLSIQQQTFTAYEVWVVDNKSTDGTMDYLKTFNAPFNWISEKDTGIYDAMNKGISLATQEWLYFLGADDALYNENVLENVFSTPIQEQFKLIIGKIQYDLKKGDSVYTNRRHGVVKSSWSMKLWIKNTVHHQGAFYHSQLFSDTAFELQYEILADYAFNLYLYTNKLEAMLIDEVIALCGARGLTKMNSYAMYKEEVRLKVDKSSLLLKPIFIVISLLKFTLKKMKSVS